MRDGLFTGKKLSDFINDRQVDFYNARSIVNFMDVPEKIAGYAREFAASLRKHG